MRFAKSLIDEMVEHAREDAPNECCGMVGGRDGAALSVHRVPNAEASPFRFEMTGQPLIDGLNAIDEAGQELVAIYHSHTRSAAKPSQTDINLATNWPDPMWIIVSLEDSENPDVKGFWIREGKVSDAELVVE